METMLQKLVEEFETPKRKALTTRMPILKKPVIFGRSFATNVKNRARYKLARETSEEFFSSIVARHQSVLRRKLGDSSPRLQEQKVTNLKRACEDLNGLIIEPGTVFSLWDAIGKPSEKRGYVNGMLLSNGRVVEGLGGGLCQLSNFLCWIFLHADTEVVERYHHSMDVFPDSGRTLPFGSGATCLYNFVDLKIKNTGDQPLQLKIWVDEHHLKGCLVSPEKNVFKYSLKELNHKFMKRGEKYFRYNEIWRVKKKEGKEVSREKMFTNFAPVLYEVTPEYLRERDYELADFSV